MTVAASTSMPSHISPSYFCCYDCCYHYHYHYNNNYYLLPGLDYNKCARRKTIDGSQFASRESLAK